MGLAPHPSGRLRVELAQTLAASGCLRDATETYLDAFQDGFRHPLILTNLGAALYTEGRVAEAVIAYRLALSKDRRFKPAWSNLLLALNSLEEITPLELANEHRLFGSIFENSFEHRPNTRPRHPGRLRLGFVSSSFFRHAVTQFLEPVLRSLDRRTFQIFCYQANTHEDAVTQRLKSLPGRWRVIASHTDAEALAVICRDDIDLLIDLDGHTGDNRLSLFAAKPARVQLSWLGYPNTTGLRSMDYRLTDPIADPAPFTDALHSERLIRLDPPFLVFVPPDDAPAISSAPAAKNGYVTFGMFNQLHKLSGSLVTAVSRVLTRVVGSRLLLKSTAFADDQITYTTAERFKACGVDPARLRFAGPTPSRRSHLESHHDIDIMLDSFPYTGTTTTCEALWMGIPVVTLEGLTHRSRVGSSLLQAVGLPHLVAKSLGEYVSIAVTLASDPAGCALLRSQMRDRMLSSPLMNLPAFVKRFETALLTAANPSGTRTPF